MRILDNNQKKKKRKIISLSIPEELYEQLEEIRKDIGNENRSQFFNNILRKSSQEYFTQYRNVYPEQDYLGLITILFSHHKNPTIQTELTNIQHKFTDHGDKNHFNLQIIFNTHLHLSHDECAEFIVCKGKYDNIKNLKENLSIISGIKMSSFTILQKCA